MTYSLAEILEYNDITEAQAFMVLNDFYGLEFPPEPCDASPTR